MKLKDKYKCFSELCHIVLPEIQQHNWDQSNKNSLFFVPQSYLKCHIPWRISGLAIRKTSSAITFQNTI